MPAKPLKILKVSLLALAGAVVLFVCVGSALLWMASSQPVQYAPVQLTPAQQDESMHEFVYRIQEFGNQTGVGQPFSWSLTQEQINSYIASMDAIDALAHGATHPSEQLKRLGFSSPTVVLHEGYLTLMVYLDRQDKVASADVAIEYDRDGNVRAAVRALRIGLVQVPESVWMQKWQHVQQEVAQRLASTDGADAGGAGPIGGISAGAMGKMLSRVLDMLQGKYVRPEVVWPVGRQHVLIDQVKLEEGKLTIHTAPLNPASSTQPGQ